MSINQAHLIHDHSSGRSSTRLHAPPGGQNSMGTSFGWSDEPAAPARQINRRDPNASSVFGGDAPAPNVVQQRRNKHEFVDNRIGAGIENKNAPQQPQQQQPAAQKDNVGTTSSRIGFGDTGASSVKVHHAPGGASSGNIIGGWN
uniref:Microtubule-associated protein Jupiter n=1 Tax=Hemiselmis andersenii TaxID=464988 RepID=A0A6T8GG47_HEMAN|mmetsp:Transcript_1018/g.2432  ORF Transcript_1018/g.2432 Transcript_1018/m.2432 type:complete len:145 (+) Transcript_1018:39-473(+)|eukprot:CAMPEP_0114124292 /NCGR_PEP_ID=MMETSP0043_2-20121206/8703_1 /TAXON_ID=464988 /ORGANISM="Hemiselmis andersenii, Strain CCMP644" /LENGTH=144 /DNA_ID=CAMNT_0001217169 /DNA_START=29 /DNA_END=463 /DNA_ORIENTATION=+